MRLLGGKRKQTVRPKKAGKSGSLLAGRGIAIAILAVVSGACFALGFFVGKSTSEGQLVTEIITVAAEPDEVPVQYGAGLPVARSSGNESGNAGKDAGDSGNAQASGTGTVYTVQIGAFTASEEARGVRGEFRNKGYPAYILESRTAEKKTIYRVRVGRYNNKSDAIRMALKLKRHEGTTSFVTANK